MHNNLSDVNIDWNKVFRFVSNLNAYENLCILHWFEQFDVWERLKFVTEFSVQDVQIRLCDVSCAKALMNLINIT